MKEKNKQNPEGIGSLYQNIERYTDHESRRSRAIRSR